MPEMQNGSPENGFFTEHHHTSGQNDHLPLPSPPSNISQRQATDPLTSEKHSRNSSPQNQPLDDEAPPTKKRKLTDSATPRLSTSKPVSPPWKKIAVDGPTSFVEGGRRKSSRTNFVPLELQPQAERRQTRGTIHHAPVSTNKLGTVSNLKPSSLNSSSSPHQGHGKRPRSSGKPASAIINNSPAKSVRSHLTPIPNDTNATSLPVKRSHRRKNIPPPVTQSSRITNPRRTRRRRQSSESVERTRNDQKMMTNGTHESEEDDERMSTELDDQPDGDSDDDVIAAEQRGTEGPKYKPQRVNLRVRMPTVKIQHPDHVALPRRYSSFTQWLDNETSTVRDDNIITDSSAREEALLRLRILEAAQPGGVLSEERCSAYAPEPQDEPPQQYAHRDHFIAHAVYFHKLMVQEQKSHIAAARRLAHAAVTEWTRRQPKSNEDIARERHAALLSQYKQTVVQVLVKKWDLVTAEVTKRRRQRWDEEQQRLGKQALNKVLEQSTQLLDKRRLRGSSAVASTCLDSGNEDGEDVEPGESPAGSESHDEDNMSSSQQESDDDKLGNDEDDEGLTVEELRRKYSAISALGSENGPVGIRAEEDSAMHVDPGGHGVATRNNPLRSTEEDTEQPTGSMDLDEVDDILMDESDESTDMDDESDESEEEPSQGSGGEDDDEDEAEETGGLLGFFAKKDYQDKGGSNVPAHETFPLEMEEDFDDEAEEVSLVPDAAQVQTPCGSTMEDPYLDNGRGLNPLKSDNTSREKALREKEEAVLQSESRQSITKNSPAASLTPVNPLTLPNHSLPTTPVSTNPLKTPVPSLLRGTLREYQHFGLDWLAGLYANGTNGILADEMGLGKTIQTIALLAHLAVEHEEWGPHLVVVPTSVILNWEVEFKKFLPGFKVLTYYGSQEERKRKRQGWMNKDKWHVWITSYQIALADQVIFRRRGWHFMVLDEAHNIKNFQSQRWQTLLTFKTRARLLLTGTPLQNKLSELWSLLFFLMPTDSKETGIGGFADLQEFQEWFRKPVEQILEHGRETMDDEAKAIVQKLHKVLRPFILRRLKADVEKQMPGKYEHVITCRLSRRQRHLYDGFMSRAQTRETLASGNYLSIINCLMQLRKVCNHPDLFETREIVTSFAMPRSAVVDYEIKDLLIRRRLLQEEPMTTVDLGVINLLPGANEPFSALETIQRQRLGALGALRQLTTQQWGIVDQGMPFDSSSIVGALATFKNTARRARFEQLRHTSYLTSLRSQRRPLYSHSLLDRVRIDVSRLPMVAGRRPKAQLSEWYLTSSTVLADMVPTLAQRSTQVESIVEKFGCVTPNVVAADIVPLTVPPKVADAIQSFQANTLPDPFHQARMRLSIAFPDKRLLQYDCGKLQKLDSLLRELQAGGHRALIFTQMTRVLDILEQFLNIHGHRYLRLDGATKIENRQVLTERFNNDNRILVFILSSRSGGLGINLTGADTVIFYDLDWNPAMDKQCQDRCHRIGQTRDVHIYRFVSESTIEANILRKANQKRMLDDVVIQQGEFTTDYFTQAQADDSSLGHGDDEASAAMDRVIGGAKSDLGKVFDQVEDLEDIAAARVAEKEMTQTDAADFEERTRPGSRGAGTSKTPDLQVSRQQTMAPPSSFGNENPDRLVANSGEDAATHVKGEQVEQEAGHVDEYMIRFMEWELQDVPLAPSVDKKRKRGAKSGGEHQVKRRR